MIYPAFNLPQDGSLKNDFGLFGNVLEHFLQPFGFGDF